MVGDAPSCALLGGIAIDARVALITRTRNVREYMLVLALCLVSSHYNALPYMFRSYLLTHYTVRPVASPALVREGHKTTGNFFVAHKTRHRASTEHSLTFRVRRYVVIATQPMHRLEMRPIVHN